MKKIREKIYKFISIAFFAVILLSFLYIIMVHREFKDNQFVFDDESIEEWNDNWEINYDGVIEEKISLPINVPVERGNAVILRKKLPDKIKNYNCIMISGKRQDIVVSIGGIQRAIFSNDGYRPFGKSSPSGIIIVPLYNTDSQSDIAIRFSSDSVFSGQIDGIFIGTEKSVLFKILKSNTSWIFLNVIVFIIGVICFLSYVIYGSSFEISKTLLYLAVFAVLSSVWSFTQSGLRQILFSDITTYESVGYCCYLLIPISILLYVNWVTKRKYVRVIRCFLYVIMLNFTAENVLQAFFKIAFFEMRYVGPIVYMVSAIVALIICILEIRKEWGYMTKTLLIGVIGLILGGYLNIMSCVDNYQWGVFNRYIAGAAIFLVSGFLYTMMSVRKEQNLRKDAESANLAKSLFLASMSHEIKTPINAVIGMNEMIMRDSNDEKVLEYAANINSAGKSLLSLVNDVLDFSKIEDGKMEINPVNYQLKPVLEDTVSMARRRLKDKDIKLILDIDELIPAGYFGDEVRVKQVISNIMSNAIKYTHTGSITFTVKCLSIEYDVASLYISIKDTGIGIKTEDIPKFMESFTRTDHVKNSNISGTGLGLSITCRLLTLMDSKLEVDSVYGEGSDFHFVLKQRVVDKVSMGPLVEKVEKTVKKNKIDFTAPNARALVVDDSKINLKVACGLLKPTEMQIDSCESGKECLKLCRENHYDIIFMDHMMPEMDGIEAFKRIREDKTLKSTDSPIVVLTANTVSGSREMYEEVGFDYYMKKPIDVLELGEVIKKYVS